MSTTIATQQDTTLEHDTHDEEFTHGFVSCTEASRLTGKSYWQIRRAAALGRIEAVSVAGRTVLKRQSVLEFAEGQK